MLVFPLWAVCICMQVPLRHMRADTAREINLLRAPLLAAGKNKTLEAIMNCVQAMPMKEPEPSDDGLPDPEDEEPELSDVGSDEADEDDNQPTEAPREVNNLGKPKPPLHSSSSPLRPPTKATLRQSIRAAFPP